MESVELILKLFPEEETAGRVLHRLQELERQRQLHLVDAAVVLKDHQGISSLQETRDVDAWRGALAGAVAGGLLGLLGGPAGALIGAAAGAATGGIMADKLDLGFSNEFLKELRVALQPGTSVIVLIVNQPWGDTLVQVLDEFSGRLLRHALRSEVIQQLKESQS